jgi:hypothetical protein
MIIEGRRIRRHFLADHRARVRAVARVDHRCHWRWPKPWSRLTSTCSDYRNVIFPWLAHSITVMIMAIVTRVRPAKASGGGLVAFVGFHRLSYSCDALDIGYVRPGAVPQPLQQ